MPIENWKEYRDQGKIIRSQRLLRHKEYLYDFCQKNNLHFEQIQEWQIRVSDGKQTVDFFPKAKKYHNITKDMRGRYEYIGAFLRSVFNVRAKEKGKRPRNYQKKQRK